jgi:PAS domain S-box-containing protein
LGTISTEVRIVTEMEEQLTALNYGDHVCLICENAADRLIVGVIFTKLGLARGDRCIYIAAERPLEDIRLALTDSGVDLAREEQRGALRILAPNDTCPGSQGFVPETMIEFYRNQEACAIAEGFAGLSVAAEANWASGPEEDNHRLIEYEELPNQIVPCLRAVILCLYNRHRSAPPESVLSPEEAARSSEPESKRIAWRVVQSKGFIPAHQERGRVMKELKAEGERIHALLNNCPTVVLIQDRAGRFVYASEGVRRITGLASHEVLGKTPLDVFPVEVGRHLTAIEDGVLASQKSQEIVESLPAPGGGVQYWQIVKFPVPCAGEQLLGSTWVEITAQKQAEEELRKEKEILQNILDSSPAMIALNDEAGQWRFINRSCQDILGWSLEEVRKHPDFTAACFPDPELRERARKFLDEADGIWADFPVTTRDGRIIDALCVSVRLFDGTILGMACDITERRQAEKTVHDNVELLKRLSSRLMEVQETERHRLALELHDEIGQLLTGLRLLLRLNKDLPPEAYRNRFEQARAVVDDLISRVRGLSFDLRPADLDQLGLLPALLAIFERYTAQTGVLVNFKHQGVEKRFPSQVETVAYRVVQEALTNAARHAGVAGLTVRVWADTDKLNLQIEDRGSGFDADAALKSPHSSGLHGMRERIMTVGGHITIESSPGAGTTITAELPLASDREAVTLQEKLP